MATGILGQVECTTNNQVVYTVPSSTFAVVTVSFTNRDTTNREIRLAITNDEQSLSAELWKYIEFDAELLPSGVLERSGLVVDAGQKIVVFANSTNVGVTVYGIETSTV